MPGVYQRRATKDYSDVLDAAGYIEEEPLLPVVSYMPPMCDLDYYSIIVLLMGAYLVYALVHPEKF